MARTAGKTVEELNEFYIWVLRVGFAVLRQAADSRDDAWIDAEIELLHNVPSLLSEPNLARHRYFWFKERKHYVEWASAAGRDHQKSRMLTYYEPIWREMEPVLLGLLGGE